MSFPQWISNKGVKIVHNRWLRFYKLKILPT